MNKILLYVIVIVSFFSISTAQIINSYGIKTGITRANHFYDYSNDFILNDEEFIYRNGFNLGVFAELFELKYFSLVIDFYYNQKGMKDEIEITYIYNSPDGYATKIIQLDNRMDYLTLNTNGKIRYNLNELTPYILAGIKYDILIDKKIDRSIENLFEKRLYYNNYYDNYKGNIFGFNLGLGIESKQLFKVPILLEFVYNYDITKVIINENLEIKNLSYEIKVGIKI